MADQRDLPHINSNVFTCQLVCSGVLTRDQGAQVIKAVFHEKFSEARYEADLEAELLRIRPRTEPELICRFDAVRGLTAAVLASVKASLTIALDHTD